MEQDYRTDASCVSDISKNTVLLPIVLSFIPVSENITNSHLKPLINITGYSASDTRMVESSSLVSNKNISEFEDLGNYIAGINKILNIGEVLFKEARDMTSDEIEAMNSLVEDEFEEF